MIWKIKNFRIIWTKVCPSDKTNTLFEYLYRPPNEKIDLKDQCES